MTRQRLQVRLARDELDIRAAQRLRYMVFVEELGAVGSNCDHRNRLERDDFDSVAMHLLLVDPERNPDELEHVVGVYRMLDDAAAARAGRFYSETEYDISPLKDGGRSLLELGRSCLHPEFRGGNAMYMLWNGLADHVLNKGIEILFGTASFHGTSLDRIAPALSYLYANHLAPEDLRVRALPQHYQSMALAESDEPISRLEAMRLTPALIKAYLRLGGFVGDGAFIDHDFNTVDVCLVMDTHRMNAHRREHYVKGHRK